LLPIHEWPRLPNRLFSPRKEPGRPFSFWDEKNGSEKGKKKELLRKCVYKRITLDQKNKKMLK